MKEEENKIKIENERRRKPNKNRKWKPFAEYSH